MTIDQKKDRILNAADFTPRPFSHLYKTSIDPGEKDSEGVIFPLMDEMISERLIKISDGTDPKGEFVTLAIRGKKVKESGGFLKVKFDSMTEEQKVHRLLEFMATTGGYHWTPHSLKPAFDNLLNEYEIEYLCLILIDNDEVNDNRTKDGFAIGFNAKSKSTFYGKKYLSVKRSQEVKLDVGQIQNIKNSVINAPISQTGDDLSFNTTNNRVNNPPTQGEIKQNPNTWTASNIMFVILSGIIVGLLVLIFWEKIKVFL